MINTIYSMQMTAGHGKFAILLAFAASAPVIR